MAQTYTTLPSLFTAIASAIRTKTGTTSAIVADKFPDYITTVYNAAKVGTASAADVRASKTFTNSSTVGATGMMADASTGTASSGTLVATKTPSTSIQYVNVTAGYTAAKYWKINAMTAGSATVTGTTWTANPTISVSTKGVVTSTYNTTKSVGASVTSGYITSATAGTMEASGTTTYQISTFAATTYTPSTAVQTASVKDKYCTGNITIKAMPVQMTVLEKTMSSSTKNFSYVNTGGSGTAALRYYTVTKSEIGFDPDAICWQDTGENYFKGCWFKIVPSYIAFVWNGFLIANTGGVVTNSSSTTWGGSTQPSTYYIPANNGGAGTGTGKIVFVKF